MEDIFTIPGIRTPGPLGSIPAWLPGRANSSYRDAAGPVRASERLRFRRQMRALHAGMHEDTSWRGLPGKRPQPAAGCSTPVARDSMGERAVKGMTISAPTSPLVEVKNLRKYFTWKKGLVLKAVDDVSFVIGKGETLACR